MEEGSLSGPTCSTDFTGSTLYNATGMTDTTKTLSGLSSTVNAYASGVGSWSATDTAPNNTKVYRFTWELQDNDGANGKTASATFTWRGRTTVVLIGRVLHGQM